MHLSENSLRSAQKWAEVVDLVHRLLPTTDRMSDDEVFALIRQVLLSSNQSAKTYPGSYQGVL